MPEPLNVVLRGTIAFFTLLVLARLMGKKQISQLTYFDYVTGITVGSIAATLTTDLTVAPVPSWVGLLTWTFWVLFLGIITTYSRYTRKIVDGEPTVVVQNGQILESNIKQMNYTVDDLRGQLREKNAFNLADVEFAILEPNGNLSVQKKSQLQPVTPSDLQIPTGYKGLSVELITDGHVVQENLKQVNLSEEWLIEQIQGRNLSLQDVYYAELSTDGKLYVDLHDDLDHLPEDQDISDK